MNKTTRKQYTPQQVADEEIIKSLPGFRNRYENVRGICLHFVEGGQGEPLILLPGYPETWWAYHKVMPLLKDKYHLIVLDIRGMGSSGKPPGGYDKKNIAGDISELMETLNLPQACICGHDIGTSIAYSLAANFPEKVSRLILLDTPPPDDTMYQLPMLPIPGANYTYPWWVAFNQVKELPERMLQGRFHYMLDWMFDHLLLHQESINDFDRAVYANAYDSEEGIRASNAWYQAFGKDIEDRKGYEKITVPTLGIAGSGYDLLQKSLSDIATDHSLVRIKDSGHFILAEQPEATAVAISDFLK